MLRLDVRAELPENERDMRYFEVPPLIFAVLNDIDAAFVEQLRADAGEGLCQLADQRAGALREPCGVEIFPGLRVKNERPVIHHGGEIRLQKRDEFRSRLHAAPRRNAEASALCAEIRNRSRVGGRERFVRHEQRAV